MARPTDASKQRQWLDLVRRWQQSQLTVRAFCSRHQVSEPSFYSWRRLLRQRGLIATRPAGTPPSQIASQSPTFVKLSLPDEPATSAAVEVVLGRRLLRVRPGFDPDMLRQLLRLLEEAPC